MTPLHVSAEKGRYRIVEYLVGIRAGIGAVDNDGVGTCDD